METDLLSSDLLSNGQTSQSWVRPESGARSFSELPYVGSGAQVLRPSSVAFPEVAARSYTRGRGAGFQTGTHVGCCHPRHGRIPTRLVFKWDISQPHLTSLEDLSPLQSLGLSNFVVFLWVIQLCLLVLPSGEWLDTS